MLRRRLGRGRLSTEREKGDKAGNSEYAAHCLGSPDPLAPELREPVRALWQDRGALSPYSDEQGVDLLQIPLNLPESLAEKELSDFSPLWFLRGLRFYEGPQHVLD